MIDFSVQPSFITMHVNPLYTPLCTADGDWSLSFPTESRVIPPKVIGLLLPPLLRAPQPVNKDRLLTWTRFKIFLHPRYLHDSFSILWSFSGRCKVSKMKLGACPRLGKYIIAIEKTNYSDSHCPLLENSKLSYKKIVNIIVKSKFTWLEKKSFPTTLCSIPSKKEVNKITATQNLFIVRKVQL